MGVLVSLKCFLLLPLAVCNQKKSGVYLGIVDVEVEDLNQISGFFLKMRENQYKKFRGSKYLQANNGKWTLKTTKARYGFETQCPSDTPDAEFGNIQKLRKQFKLNLVLCQRCASQMFSRYNQKKQNSQDLMK